MFNAQGPVAYLWRDALQHAGCNPTNTTSSLLLNEECAPAPIANPAISAVPEAQQDVVPASDQHPQ